METQNYTAGVVHRYRYTLSDAPCSIVWAYVYDRRVWAVWTVENGAQCNVRAHGDFEDAQADYQRRVAFIKILRGEV